jgi:hypothetical protein
MRSARLPPLATIVGQDGTSARRQPPGVCPTTARTAVVIAALGLAALVAACGGGSPASSAYANAGRATGTPSALVFARCMRSHGVRRWPDPDGSGQFAKSKVTVQRLGVIQSQLQAAARACQHLYPNGGPSSTSQDPTMMVVMFRFARCVRARGVSKWPDPVAESDPGEPGTPGFPRDIPGVNQGSPAVKAAMRNCQHLMAGIGYASGGYP